MKPTFLFSFGIVVLTDKIQWGHTTSNLLQNMSAQCMCFNSPILHVFQFTHFIDSNTKKLFLLAVASMQSRHLKAGKSSKTWMVQQLSCLNTLVDFRSKCIWCWETKLTAFHTGHCEKTTHQQSWQTQSSWHSMSEQQKDLQLIFNTLLKFDHHSCNHLCKKWNKALCQDLVAANCCFPVTVQRG